MITVKISGEHPSWPLLRQTPGAKGVWGDCRFVVNEDVAECDYWVVQDGLSKPETALCPPQNTILVTGEPPTVRPYSPRFTAQFATVVTCQTAIKHPHVVYSQQALPWHLLNKSYDDLAHGPGPEKTKTLSVISSDKAFTEGHRQRVEFVRRLKQALGGGIDHFGPAPRIPNKWDAMADYKYTVVIENSSFRDYWTEKLADAFLADAYPFYFGCPNIADYFPDGGYIEIDIHDFDRALKTIQDTVARGRFEVTVGERRRAKDLVLNRYNLFPMLAAMTSAAGGALPKKRVSLQPEAALSGTLLRRTARWVKRRIMSERGGGQAE